MTPPFVSVKDLDKFQHYKHRNPPWVKLHYSLLDDPVFLALDEVQQCRYFKLIMLASRQMNCISTNPEYLGRVMRIPEQVDLTPLFNAGFLLASRKRQSTKMLAPPHENRSQSRVEKRREEPPLPPKGDDGFQTFYKAYPKKKAPRDAEKAWRKLAPSPELQATILTAIDQAKQSPDWQKDCGQFIPYPATWLNGQRWEDETEVSLPTPPELPGEFDHLPRISGDFAICGCDRQNPEEVCRAAYHGLTVEEHSRWLDAQAQHEQAPR